MPATTNHPTVSAAQYDAIYDPMFDLTPQKLFDIQVEIVQDKGLDLSDQDVDRLREFIPKQSLRFLLIPPEPSTLDLNGLMALIEVEGREGRNYLDPRNLTNVVKTPAMAHILFDIEDGRGRLNMKPSVSSKDIHREKRLAYPAWYGLVHGIVFPRVLRNHSLVLCGSHYGLEDMPCLSLCEDIRLELRSARSDYAFPEWGAPSAGSIAGA